MLKIEFTDETLMVNVNGNLPQILTELTLATQHIYEGLDDDKKRYFKIFLEDLFPTMVCDPDMDFNKLSMKSIMKLMKMMSEDE